MSYLLQGKIDAKTGKTEALAQVLLQASRLVANAKGCRLYVIAKNDAEAHSVYVTEIWDSKQDHDDSLKNPEVRALIMQAIPLVEGQPAKGLELQILGGKGA